MPRVHVIPHGASVNVSARHAGDGSARRPVVLTWGLLGPDKGIEFGIEAVSRLRDFDPPPRYVVHGEIRALSRATERPTGNHCSSRCERSGSACSWSSTPNTSTKSDAGIPAPQSVVPLTAASRVAGMLALKEGAGGNRALDF
jgi:hypothetical protein